MLSYRHAFHAGNHADVLKHLVLLHLVAHLRHKEKPFWAIDTHAGAGLYALDTGHATKLAEYETGIGRLWTRSDMPNTLENYAARVRSLASNREGALRAYPGSPWLVFEELREEDRMRLFELHPSDCRLLRENFREAGRRVLVEESDGFAGLKALLPPPSRRGLILIDPSYEEKQDYRRVIAAIEDALARFATGIYALWHPLLNRAEARQLPERLKRLPAKNWLHATLGISTPASGDFGMHGSGMFVINPPWTLRRTLEDVMPYLVRMLGQDDGAGYILDAQGD